MPAIGFICPQDGKEVHFDFCFRSCPARCHPLPLLVALSEERGHEPGVYHGGSEIWNPPKAVYLSRHENYYVKPDSMAYVTFGTAYHLLMESGAKRLAGMGITDNALLEQSFRTGVGEAFFYRDLNAIHDFPPP